MDEDGYFTSVAKTLQEVACSQHDLTHHENLIINERITEQNFIRCKEYQPQIRNIMTETTDTLPLAGT